VWFTVSHFVRRPFGIAVDVSGPVRTGTITGPEGSASVGAWLAGANLYLDHDAGNGFYGRVAVGAAAIRLTTEGSAEFPLVASSRSTLAAAVYARADGGFEVAWWLRLGLRAV